MSAPALAAPPRPLDGMAVVVTGEVPGMDRDAARAAVVALGGTSAASVGARTSLVVAGDGAGHSKMAKAAQHAVPVLTGEAFASLVEDPSTWTGLPTTTAAPPPAAAPVAVSDHPVTQVVTFAAGHREVRLACSCGHRWPGRSVHDLRKGCPLDPYGYPRATWSAPLFTTEI